MAFVRTKCIAGKTYYYLVENKHIGGKVRQKVLKYLGKNPPSKEEIEAMLIKIKGEVT